MERHDLLLWHLLSVGESGEQRYTESQLNAFKAIGIIGIFAYLTLGVLAAYNSYFFLYKQKRYKIYFITTFYGLAYVVILSRFVLNFI